jgi:Spy/CpxP family protein refolding chaperone
MRSFIWLALFFVLVFGIGWTSRLLAERPADQPERTHRSERGGWSRSHGGYGPGGPFIQTIEQFGEELALTEEQRTKLDAIMQETVAQIETHEHAIRDLMYSTRPRVLAILTEAQRAALDERIAEERREHAQERLTRQMDWLAENTELDATALADLEGVLIRYAEAKTRLFEGLWDQSAWPDEDELRQAVKELRSERDAGLANYLDEETMQNFQSGTDRRRRGKP